MKIICPKCGEENEAQLEGTNVDLETQTVDIEVSAECEKCEQVYGESFETDF